jgi:hypothetical protein
LCNWDICLLNSFMGNSIYCYVLFLWLLLLFMKILWLRIILRRYTWSSFPWIDLIKVYRHIVWQASVCLDGQVVPSIVVASHDHHNCYVLFLWILLLFMKILWLCIILQRYTWSSFPWIDLIKVYRHIVWQVECLSG